MALESISGIAPRAQEKAPAAVATPARPVIAPPEQAPESARRSNAEPPVRGVPQRLGVQQQLPPNTRLRVDEESNRIVAQILDENNEVVRQIPPEALLELSTRFNRLEGLLFDRET